MPYDTRELLARLLQCEAGGEGINGMMAVATVIMNRANALTGEFARVRCAEYHTAAQSVYLPAGIRRRRI